MIQKAEAFIREHGMIPAGCTVIAGVSGGGDSMALLDVLKNLMDKLDFTLFVVHVHHGLRGPEADRDAALVEEICSREGIPCRVFRYKVAEIADREKLGLEEAGRKVRREAFAVMVQELEKKGTGPVRIALAHHANDLAETMIHHMARGTGLRGLGAMKPVQEPYIRPFLCLERAEIEHYLMENKIPYETDSTNLLDDYTRNRIRHQVLDTLIQEVNPRAVAHMAQLARIAVQADEYLEQEAERLARELVQNREPGIFLKEDFTGEAEILQMYLIKGILAWTAGRERDLTGEHFRQIRELADRQVGRRLRLPYGVVVHRTYQGLLFVREEAGEQKHKDCREQELLVPGQLDLGQGVLEARIFFKEDEKIPEKKYTKWFDYDKIKGTLCIRSRRQGDYLVVNARGSTKKLSRYFIDEKIPGQQRDDQKLVACGPEILWVIGGRRGESFQVSEQTQRILELNYKGGKLDE